MRLEHVRKRFIPMSETMFYILFSLTQARHGYGIMQHVERLTNGRLVLGAGTIYQSLSKLEKRGPDCRCARVRQEKRISDYASGTHHPTGRGGTDL